MDTKQRIIEISMIYKFCVNDPSLHTDNEGRVVVERVGLGMEGRDKITLIDRVLFGDSETYLTLSRKVGIQYFLDP